MNLPFRSVLPAGLVLLALIGACAQTDIPVSGRAIYDRYCATCHQADGTGIDGAFPSLRDSPWVPGDEGRLVRLVLGGMKGPLTRGGQQFNNTMPPHYFLDDQQVAAVLSYVRSSFGHAADSIVATTVAAVRRDVTPGRAWHPSELETATGVPGQ